MSLAGCDTESMRSERSGRSSQYHHRSNLIAVAGGHPQGSRVSSSRHHRRSTSSRLSSSDTTGDNRNRILKSRSHSHRYIDPGVEGMFQHKDEVKIDISPPDDNWGENTTCLTGNTSERSYDYNCDKSRHLHAATEMPSGVQMKCSQFLGSAFAFFICFIAFLSPVAMVVLPRTPIYEDWKPDPCSPACEGKLLNLVFEELILLIGMWALFYRRSVVHLPRIMVSRAFLLAFVFLMTFAFWLFYGVRIVQRREPNYVHTVEFAQSLADSLLVVYYLYIILSWILPLRTEFTLSVLRSPDGVCMAYSVGALSIQRAAEVVLQHYYRDFPQYNPALERITIAGGRMHHMLKQKLGGSQCGGDQEHDDDDPPAFPDQFPSGAAGQFKVYDVDGPPNSELMGGDDPRGKINAQAIMAAAARKRDTSHNERFYLELEWERKVKRRRARLLTAAEEAFLHVKRMGEEKGPSVPMDPQEAAQAVFPALARALQKYLRVTRQSSRHSAEQIVQWMKTCLAFDMSPRSFLERFFSAKETPEAAQAKTKWSIVCDHLVSGGLSHGTVFQLRCHTDGADLGVFLLVNVRKLPFFNIIEEVFDAKSNRFVLRLNSETSV